MIVTKQDKIPIAHKMTRVVHGERGDYIEIEDLSDIIIVSNLDVPSTQTWRMTKEWIHKVYYTWWETADGVKLYYQMKTVDYADYQLGFWYVSVNDVEEIPDD